ncbi:MAG: right-handed parallel beta-helix repeat-containing protein, partial [Proteobacteria bacterium]|nr:right-handed parallel beta-helix repeat-containing protein [Pseudomonadota bacterium]
MRGILVVVLSLVAFACLCGTAFATDYFVATWGDDGWPGTIDQPFETITQGTQTAQAGDTVNVRAGDYAEGRLDFYRDGAPGAYITVQSYDGDLAAHVTDGIWVHGRAYIKIIGMEVSNSTNVLHVDPGDNLVPRSQYIYIQRCYLHDSTGGDVFKANQSDYVYLEDSELLGPPGDELCDWVWTNYSECRRCYLHDYSGIGFTIKGGSLYCILEDTVISHAVDSASKATRFGGSTDAKYRNPDSDYATEYTVYRNNIIRDCTAPAGGSYECWYAYFYNNTLHDCGEASGAIFTH